MAAGAVHLSDAQPGWTFLDVPEHEEQARTVRSRVSFEQAFASAPVVQLGITGFDIDNGANARLSVVIVGIDPRGFDVELRSWCNSRLWSVDLGWIAIGHCAEPRSLLRGARGLQRSFRRP